MGVVPATARTTEERLRAGWIHALGLPRIVSLCDTGDRLCQRPVEGLDALFSGAEDATEISLTGDWQRLEAGNLSVARLDLTLPDTDGAVEVAVRADADLTERTVLRFYPRQRRLALDFSAASVTPTSRRDTLWADIVPGATDVTVFVDKSVVTVFTGHGESFAFRTFPEGAATGTAFVRGPRGATVMSRTAVFTSDAATDG